MHAPELRDSDAVIPSELGRPERDRLPPDSVALNLTMMAANYPTQPGMGPGHPAAMAHGHPMNMHHPAGHMGQPNPGMMHPMSGPQGTPATMASGMPPNPGTPATGGPMQNPMAMAHLGGPQGPMFPGGNQQLHMGNMSQLQHQNLMAARQRAAMQQMVQQNGGQLPPGMMKTMGNMQHFNPQQLQQMGMSVPMHSMQQMTPQQQQVLQQQQNFQQQQRYMAHQAMQQQAMVAAQQRQAQQQQQQNQQQSAQQMQMTRSQEPATQPPQPQSTPAPQPQPQPQATPTSQSKPQPQPPTSQPQQNNATQPANPATPQVKQPEAEDEASVKSELSKQQIIPDVNDMKVPPASFAGQSILQLLSYQDALANPEHPHDYDYWQLIISRYFSPFGSIRQQVFSPLSNHDKAFQLQFASLARFYYSHFKNGIKQILMQANNYNMHTLDNGGYMIYSGKSTITYVYDNDVRVTTLGSIKVNFDENQRIECLFLETKGWSEHVPRALLQEPASPEQTRSPKTKKNQKNQQSQQSQPGFKVPRSPCGVYGLPDKLLQFLEVSVRTFPLPFCN